VQNALPYVLQPAAVENFDRWMSKLDSAPAAAAPAAVAEVEMDW